MKALKKYQLNSGELIHLKAGGGTDVQTNKLFDEEGYELAANR